MSSNSDKREPTAGLATSSCVERALSAIDGVIRRGRLPEPLRRRLTSERNLVEGGPIAATPHHPDSQCVLRLCRERHPNWSEFPEQTVRVVLYRLLNDRRTQTILRQIGRETADIIDHVLARIIALSPDGSDDDACWVWYHLARNYPEKAAYDYTDEQICFSWWFARHSRRRDDTRGAGGPRPKARRQRRLALQQWLTELERPLAELLRVDIDDYNPHDGSVAVACESCRLLMRLSKLAQQKTDKWLRLRGVASGCLFDLPDLPEFWEEPLSTVHCRGDFVTDDRLTCGTSLAEEEFLDRLCEGKSELACAFILQNACERGGDWSPAFIERVKQRAGSLADHAFSRYERRKLRGLFTRALATSVSNG